MSFVMLCNVPRLFAALCLLFLATIPLSAQTDLSESYTFASGASFDYPAEWTPKEGLDTVSLSSADTQVYVLDDAALRSINVASNAEPADALQVYFEKYHSDRPFRTAKIVTLDMTDRTAVQYDFSAEDGRALIIAMRFNAGTLALIEALSNGGKLKEVDIVLAVAESFVSTGEAGTSSGGSSSSVAVHCTISTSYENTVRVRVGPGENRASLGFLPTDEDFEVLGQGKANDGTKWWKLDVDVVAPGKAANEAWVAQLDVKGDGNCEAVADVNAPPVIPISSGPPANTGGGSSSGGNNNPPPPSGSGMPTTGIYAGTIGDGNASCADIPNVNFQPATRQFAAFFQGSGSSYIYVDDGGPLVRTRGNTFSGTISYIDPSDNRPFSRTITVTVLSPTQMTGSFTDTLEIEGHMCSATLPITLNLQ
ncbi:MAG: hypothetical protein R3E39_16745 [Anaerolineae bacterium]